VLDREGRIVKAGGALDAAALERLTDKIARGGEEAVTAEMPDQWLEDLTLVGTPSEVAEKANRWLDAGLDSICVFLPDDAEAETLRLVAEEVIPRIRPSLPGARG